MKLPRVVFTTAAGIILLLGTALILSSGTGLGGTDAGMTCGADATTAADPGFTVAGFSGDQLVNATEIMNAATARGLSQQAQILGVMTALGESSLRNITYGDDIHGVRNPDGTLTSSVGLFQQQDWWGTLAQRLDPHESATLFFDRLVTVKGWQMMPPTAAAHAVQRNANADHYTPFVVPAAEIVAALSSETGGGKCTVTEDDRTLALELVAHADNGTLTGLVPDHLEQIRWIAQGKTVSGCGIDTRILRVIVVAVRHFSSVGVSDINRNCTGQTLGAGARSSHNMYGGGMAVDFYSVNRQPLTGADGLSLRLLGLLDAIVPPGSRAGQSACRAETGVTLSLSAFTQFDDSCDHLHVDVAFVPTATSELGDAG
jgi:hypothetical protein